MAVTTLKPSIKIQDQFKTIRSGFSSVAKTSVGIGKILFKKTKVKREAIVNDQKLFNKRRENSRRKISEDTLEMSQVGGAARATGTVIENSTKGLLGRIMDAIGSFIVGWLVYNLPNIIRMVENLIVRIKTSGKILGNFVKNIGKIFKGSGRLLGAVLTNLVTLDIFDTSNRVESAFTDLRNTFADLQSGIVDGIKLVTTPLGQMPGETAAGFGDDLTSAPEQVGAGERTGTVTTSGGGGGGENPKDLKSGAQLLMRKGFSEKGAAYLAGNIQQESSWNAMRKPWVLNDGASTNKGLISWNKTRITAAEKFLGKPLETATASEQIDWIKEEMKQYGVLKTFQDKNASDEQLKKSSYGYIGWRDLGERWKYSEVALQHLKKSGSGSSQLQSTPAPAPSPAPSPAQTTSAPTPAAINPRKTISKGTKVGDTIKSSGFGMRWGKQHGGIDLECDTGTYISCKYPCKVVEARYQDGYGYYTDIIIPSLNIRLRFAHLSSQLIKSGDVPAGKPFARSGNSGSQTTGPHIHMEATRKMGGTAYGGDFNPDPYVDAMIFSKKPPQGFVAPAIPSANITPPAQITLPKPGQQVPPTSRRAPQVAIVNDIPQQQMQDPQNVGAQSAPMMMPTMDKSKVLNSLIKNHLLLDLAYT